MDNNAAHIYISAIAVSLMFLLILGSLVLFIMLFRSRNIRHRLELREADARRERELLQTRIEVQEHALQLVSMEIHDNTGQVLSMVKMMLSDAFRKDRPIQEVETLIQKSVGLLTQSISDLRGLSHIFSGKVIEDSGLVQALERELDYIRSLYGIACHYSHPRKDHMPQLEPNQVLLLFRIAQEAIQNVIKHAQATEIRCELSAGKELFRMSIRDNGKGMATDTLPRNGMGLKSIRERATMLHGTLEINSAPGNGCLIAITIQTGQNPG